MQNQRERIKTLEEILRDNPAAVDYWRSVRDGRRMADAVPDFDTAPVCDVCNGYGWVTLQVPASHPQFGKGVPCPNPSCSTVAERRETRYAQLCTLSQIPAEYQGEEVTFAGWQELEVYPQALDGKRGALGAALAFVAARERGYRFTLDEAAALGGVEAPDVATNAKCSIVFAGANGVGKTSLAVSIAKALLADSQGAVYLRLADFFDGMKERFKGKASYEFGGDEADDEATYLRQYQQAPVLVIDEFHVDSTPWKIGRVEQLINHRYTYQLPTVVTTNYSARDLEQAWGLTAIHRLEAMSHWIAVSGMELRHRSRLWVTP